MADLKQVEFGHFDSRGVRIDSHFADYMTVKDGLVLLWHNEPDPRSRIGRARVDKLVAVYDLEGGQSVRVLEATQTSKPTPNE